MRLKRQYTRKVGEDVLEYEMTYGIRADTVRWQILESLRVNGEPVDVLDPANVALVIDIQQHHHGLVEEEAYGQDQSGTD